MYKALSLLSGERLRTRLCRPICEPLSKNPVHIEFEFAVTLLLWVVFQLALQRYFVGDTLYHVRPSSTIIRAINAPNYRQVSEILLEYRNYYHG